MRGMEWQRETKMKQNFKSLLALLVTLLVSVNVNADWVDIGYFNYFLSVEQKEAYLHGFSANTYSNNLVIPSNVVYEGVTYDVTMIGNAAFSGCSSLTSITIPSSVISIDPEAFMECTNLRTVTFSEGIRSIDMSVFSGCTSLTQISFPSTLTYIGNHCFEGCEALTRVDFASAEHFCKMQYCICDYMMPFMPQSSPLYYAKHIYINGEELTDLVIPSTIKTIRAGAFYNCSSLRSVSIPSSVTSIEEYAFYGCSGLTSLSIPSSVVKIDGGAIDKDLEKFLPLINGIRYAGSCAYSVEDKTKSTYTLRSGTKWLTPMLFANCENLTSFNIPSSVTCIGEGVFQNCTNLTSVTIPEGVTAIEGGAFAWTGLTSVVLPRSLRSFEDDHGESAFYGCNSLTYVEINSDIDCYYDNVLPFSGADAIMEVKIAGDATSVTVSFMNMSNLKKITFGSEIKSISPAWFWGCNNLMSVVCESTEPPACNSVMSWGLDLSKISLDVPEESAHLYIETEPWCFFNIRGYGSPTLLSEYAETAPEEAMNVNVHVTRTLKAGEWSTLCLPINMSEALVKATFGEDVQLAYFMGHEVTEDESGNTVGINIKFQTANHIEANLPCLIKVSSNISTFVLEGVDVSPVESPISCAIKRTSRKWSEMVGTYVTGSYVPSMALFLSDNKFWYSTGATRLKGLRAYFDFHDVLTEVDDNYSIKMFVIHDEGTSIEEIHEGSRKDSQSNVVYDLSGRRVVTDENDKYRKGIYIMNGKKVLF